MGQMLSLPVLYRFCHRGAEMRSSLYLWLVHKGVGLPAPQSSCSILTTLLSCLFLFFAPRKLIALIDHKPGMPKMLWQSHQFTHLSEKAMKSQASSATSLNFTTLPIPQNLY